MFRLVLAFFLFTSALRAQTFSDFVNNVNSVAPPLRQAMVDSFLLANPVLPITEHDTVANFILTGSYNNAEIAGDMNFWQPANSPMTKVNSTNMWYAIHHYPANARFDYKYVTNGSNWILDPKNPNQVSGGFGPNSEIAMPGYVQPWEIEDNPLVSKGSIITTSIFSSNLNATFQVKVYLPPNYDSTAAYPVAYFQDGFEYISLGSANHILDNLIDSNKIEPLIGVFVKPNDRNEEYAMTKRFDYRDFFVDELVPWVDSSWSTKPDSVNRASIGASFGGNISAIIAYTRPNVFYKVGQHSGAFWPNNYETATLVASSLYFDLHTASVWGDYEGNLSNVWTVFRDSMTANSYPNKYFNRYPEGHSWGLWRATLDELLIQLFPKGSIGLKEYVSASNYVIYPNPAQTYVCIKGVDSRGCTYQVFGKNGQLLLAGYATENKPIEVSELPSGTFIIQVNNGSSAAALRFIKLPD